MENVRPIMTVRNKRKYSPTFVNVFERPRNDDMSVATTDGPICAICYDVGDTPPMHAGCACRGDHNGHLRHVHCVALEITTHLRLRGETHVGKDETERDAWRECRICKQAFTGEFALALGREHVRMSTDDPYAHTSARIHYASVLLENKRYADSEVVLRQVRSEALTEVVRRNVESHLAGCMCQTGRYSEAEPIQRRLLDWSRAYHGDDAPNTLAAANNLSMSLFYLQRHDESIALLRLVYDSAVRTHGPVHGHTLSVGVNLGKFLLLCRRFADAEPILRTAYGRAKTVFGGGSQTALRILREWNASLAWQGRSHDAEANLRIACDGLAQLPDDAAAHSELMDAYAELVEALCSQRRFAECARLLASITFRSEQQPAIAEMTARMHRLALASLKVGVAVTVGGLTLAPHYNGASGRIVQHTPTNRFVVRLSDHDATISVRLECLSLG